MLLRKRLSALVLCAVLVGSSITGIGAATKDSIIGANRYETAAKIADRMGSYSTAILVNSDKSLADGLSASSLAGKENAPILLVKKDSIPKETLSRLGSVDKVYIIGGTSAISEKVESQLAGKTIERIEGKDRVDTSKKVAQLVGNYNEAFIVNGFKGEADAMSVASVAARDKAPILFTKGSSSEREKKSSVKYYAIGGTSVISDSVAGKYSAERLSGSNRYNTNRAVIKKFYANSSKLYYAKGDPLVDALTVSALAQDSGVVLVSKTSDNTILKDKNIVQVGGMNFDPLSTNTAPVITSDTDKLEFNLGDYVDLSKFNVKAYDKEDGDLTDEIMVDKLVDFSEAGTYVLNLSVTDSDGLVGKKTITIVIKIADQDTEDKPNTGDTDYTTIYNLSKTMNKKDFQMAMIEEFESLLNEHRIDKGVKPIKVDVELANLSYLKSKHMSDLNYYVHTYNDLETKLYPEEWTESNKYGASIHIFDIYSNQFEFCVAYGENIAASYTIAGNNTPEDCARYYLNKWKNSDIHNELLLSDDTDVFGFGVYASDMNAKYATYAAFHTGKLK
ncbi:cell wall-binding repeat-containing protein [Peptacetobacter hominis]|uniref:cell wall-binding repeat-containing protein n=1 Tax=Peptacetobacter hominis TaxID=2743610 RepID=UPI0015820590|nr:cell wall-binding repeat-containing protein [Peptacetobacter hominis]